MRSSAPSYSPRDTWQEGWATGFSLALPGSRGRTAGPPLKKILTPPLILSIIHLTVFKSEGAVLFKGITQHGDKAPKQVTDFKACEYHLLSSVWVSPSSQHVHYGAISVVDKTLMNKGLGVGDMAGEGGREHPSLLLLCSLSLNLILASPFLHASPFFRRDEELTWSREAAGEAEAAATVSCSGHGRAFLDGDLSEDGSLV
ncbi:hypothetical protein EJ110_NYTH41083 [Nymphaea thermarum]|nr:hypothetical protein EJ110_NYTH41083 [Nymphaea thermarum]